MAPQIALVRNADRMMTQATANERGIECAFADGRRGIVPFANIPEIGTLANLQSIDLPNPYEMALRSNDGNAVELPWDFVRHYCDTGYQGRVEEVARRGLVTFGQRLRRLRTAAGLTQDALAARASIGRITLGRLERGEQSPRYATIAGVAKALGREPAELLVDIAPP